MKPAFSVIFLTTLIGAGQGLFLAYFCVEIFQLLNIIEIESIKGASVASALSLTLLIAGLIASFFHLGHPERAWRAAAMWRTSWLSREVILLPIVMLLIAVYTLLKYMDNQTVLFSLANDRAINVSFAIGFLACFAVILLYLCTAMIYACIKFLRQWHSPLTILNFLLMGLASGSTLAVVIASQFDPLLTGFFANWAIALSVLALGSRFLSMRRNKGLKSPSTLQTAIGIHHPNITQLAQGAMGGSFNTRAFIHTYGASVVLLARRYFLMAAFIVPIVILAGFGADALLIAVLVAAIQFSGLLVERWYFFIEAEHPQNLYYQMIS
jgi:sulfite dehydrogenase (quinone) subunit SoeC